MTAVHRRIRTLGNCSLWIVWLTALVICSPTGRLLYSQDAAPDSRNLERPRADIAIPINDLGVPVWVGKHGPEPFPVREYLDTLSRTPSEAERLYLLGLAEINADMILIFPMEEQASWEMKVTPVSDEIEALGAMDNPPPERLAALLERTSRSRELLEAAQKTPAAKFTTALTLTQLLPHCQAARTAARLACLELRHSRDTGSFADAERTLTRILRLSRDLRPGGCAIAQLVSVSLDVIMLDECAKSVLTRTDLTVGDCDRLLALFRAHQREGADILREAVRAEYVVQGHSFTLIQRGQVKPEELDESFSPINLKAFKFDAEWAELNRTYKVLLEYCAVPYHQTLVNNAFTTHLTEVKARLPVKGAPGHLVLLLLPRFPPIREAVARHATRLHGYQAVIALRRYHLTHGKWPMLLEPALGEATLPELQDPYSGKRLRYRMLAGKPLVYSVGSDQKDDAGEKNWEFGKQPGDFLFPVPELAGPAVP